MTHYKEEIPASNKAYYLRQLTNKFTKGYFDSLKIEIKREGKVFKNAVTLTNHTNANTNEFKKDKLKIEPYKIIENNIGLVNMGKLLPTEVPYLMKR